MDTAYVRRRGARLSRAARAVIHDVLESRLHLSAVPPQAAVAADAPPPVPVNFNVGHAGPGEHRVTWNDVTGETGYVVQRRRQSLATVEPFADIATLPADTRAYLDPINAAAFPAGTVLEYQLVSFNDAGRSGSQAARSITVGGPGGTGLRQRIWNDVDPVSFEPLGAPAVDRVDGIIDHAWGEASPAPGIDLDTFAVEWVGEIFAPETKAYDFSVIANDGVRLFLDDKLVVAGGWRDQPDTQYFSEAVVLTAGQKVKVRLQAYDNAGPATVQLRWNGSNNAREAVPSVYLFPTVTPTDEVATVPVRPATFPEVFALPATATTPVSIAVRWQDNAFGESGYEIERARDGAFTQDKVRFTAPRGSDQFVDRGGNDADGNPAPLAPDSLAGYHYRVRPLGAASFVPAGYATTSVHGPATNDLTLTGFPSPEMVTLNGHASTTAEGTIKLTHNQNDRTGSAFVNRAFHVDDYFRKVSFDFRIGDSNGADGMAFVIHNAAPAAPDETQLNALGQGGGGLGYRSLPDSVAVTFDVFNDIDAIGLWLGGQGVDGKWSEIPAQFKRDNSNPANLPHEPNGVIDLRDTANLTPGTSPINLNGGTVFRLMLDYEARGIPVNETDDNDGGSGLLTLRLADASDPTQRILFTTQFAVDIATAVGGDTAVMGWTAANGGLNSKTEVYNFRYVGMHGDPPEPVPPEIFVRGSAWTNSFKAHLQDKGWGHEAYGYRVYGVNRPVPQQNPEDVLPWINLNEVVLRYPYAPYAPYLPTTQNVLLDGMKADYPVAAVLPVAGDPTSFVLRLSKPLGGGDGFAVAPTSSENGDRVTLSFGNVSGFALRMNVLQGDTDHTNESVHGVLANDYSEVKKRFFKTTRSATGTTADYTAFHDVNGDGSILAHDYSEVKKRFFHSLPFSASASAAALPPAPRFADRRDRPAGRSSLDELLS